MFASALLELLQEFYAEERKERDCELLEEAARRAKAIPRTERGPHREMGRWLDRK